MHFAWVSSPMQAALDQYARCQKRRRSGPSRRWRPAAVTLMLVFLVSCPSSGRRSTKPWPSIDRRADVACGPR